MTPLDHGTRALVESVRVAHLATIAPGGRPHIVPVTFAVLADGRIATAVDAKPKSTRALARLANVRRDARTAVLFDRYDDDWAQLWWVRVDGRAEVVDGVPSDVLGALRARYPQYAAVPPAGPTIVVTPETIRTWSAAESGGFGPLENG